MTCVFSINKNQKCKNKQFSTGLCAKHFEQAFQDEDLKIQEPELKNQICSEKNCKKLVSKNDYLGIVKCDTHYQEFIESQKTLFEQTSSSSNSSDEEKPLVINKKRKIASSNSSDEEKPLVDKKRKVEEKTLENKIAYIDEINMHETCKNLIKNMGDSNLDGSLIEASRFQQIMQDQLPEDAAIFKIIEEICYQKVQINFAKCKTWALQLKEKERKYISKNPELTKLIFLLEIIQIKSN